MFPAVFLILLKLRTRNSVLSFLILRVKSAFQRLAMRLARLPLAVCSRGKFHPR